MTEDHGIDDAELRRRFDSLSGEGRVAGADTVLAGARADATRHRRNRRVAVSGVAAVLVLVVVVAAVGLITRDDKPGGVAVPASEEPPEKAITFTLHVGGTAMADPLQVYAGAHVSGQVVVENATGASVELTDGRCGAKWVVAWGGEGWEPDEAAIVTRECAAPLEVPPGTSFWPFTAEVAYPMCTSDGGETTDDRIPRCEADATMPPLPPGEYEFAFVLVGTTATDGSNQIPVILPDPIEVEVLADAMPVAARLSPIKGEASMSVTGGVITVERPDGNALRIKLLPAGTPIYRVDERTIEDVTVWLQGTGDGHGWMMVTFDCADGFPYARGVRFELSGYSPPGYATSDEFIAAFINAIECTST